MTIVNVKNQISRFTMAVTAFTMALACGCKGELHSAPTPENHDA